MTIIERISSVINSRIDMTQDTIDKLIFLAYYIGREEATKTVSDHYADHIKAQKARADSCRYNKMAAKIIGREDYIYHGDYAMEMSTIFGQDETNL